MGISFHRGPGREHGRGSSTRDFERWMKKALGMECFSLKMLSAEGSFTVDPERYVKKGSRYRYLSP
jgi:hypothetical protein